MKVLITGGHLSPALSLIEELDKKDITYVGRKYALEGDKALSLEYQTIEELGIEFVELKTGRLQRKISKYTFYSMLKVPFGLARARRILRDYKPDVVVGFGGYVSVPVIVAASMQKIPIVIHEQTMDAGFANKIVSRFADKICISWDSSRKYFPKEKTVLTGNPIRKEVVNQKEKKADKKTIYITGGSLGSHRINLAVEASIDELLKRYKVIHQTGDSTRYRDFDRLFAFREKMSVKKKENYILKKFLNPDESAEALAQASVVVSRSGVNTVSELIFLEKPSILIPLPFSQKQEQRRNALFLKDLGLGVLLDQENLEKGTFINTIDNMFENIEQYRLKDKSLFKGDSAKKILEVVKDVQTKTKTKKK